MAGSTPRRSAAPCWARPGGVALTASLLVAGFALVVSAVTLLSGPFGGAEWDLYALTLFVLLPAALAVGHPTCGTIFR